MMQKKLALLIGINYIGTDDELRGCINDVYNMKKLLKNKYNYTNFIMLTDKSITKPTKNNILYYLKKIIDLSSGYSEIFFHYSGHGTYTIDNNNDEIDNKDEALVPLDYLNNGIILDDEIYSTIKNVKCDMKIILDSCHSGTCIDLPYVSLFNEKGILITKRIDKNKSIKKNVNNIYMISGCRDDQYSSDIFNKKNKKYCGALSNNLIELLKNNMSIIQLLSSLNINLKSYTQNPSFSSNKTVNMNLNFIDNKTSRSRLNKPFRSRLNKPFRSRLNNPFRSRLNNPFRSRLNDPFRSKLNKPSKTKLNKPPRSNKPSKLNNPLKQKSNIPFRTKLNNPFRSKLNDPFRFK
jgi:metacaspase-1